MTGILIAVAVHAATLALTVHDAAASVQVVPPLTRFLDLPVLTRWVHSTRFFGRTQTVTIEKSAAEDSSSGAGGWRLVNPRIEIAAELKSTRGRRDPAFRSRTEGGGAETKGKAAGVDSGGGGGDRLVRRCIFFPEDRPPGSRNVL